ncbi:MAG: hypothetical protein CMQ20_01160 [Gammaproteobacteria bacterium]|nr:hypothetical protein [Gammaproteobacteria bacterium]
MSVSAATCIFLPGGNQVDGQWLIFDTDIAMVKVDEKFVWLARPVRMSVVPVELTGRTTYKRTILESR